MVHLRQAARSRELDALSPFHLVPECDAILLTGSSADALAARPLGLADRGCHAVKGKAAAVQVFGLEPSAAG